MNKLILERVKLKLNTLIKLKTKKSLQTRVWVLLSSPTVKVQILLRHIFEKLLFRKVFLIIV